MRFFLCLTIENHHHTQDTYIYICQHTFFTQSNKNIGLKHDRLVSNKKKHFIFHDKIILTGERALSKKELRKKKCRKIDKL